MNPIPEGWTTIATRIRAEAWEPLPRALLSIEDALALRALGRIEWRETTVGRRVLLAIKAKDRRP